MDAPEPTIGHRIVSFFQDRVTPIEEVLEHHKMGLNTGPLLSNLLLHFIATFEVMIGGFEAEYGGINPVVDGEIEKMQETVEWTKLLFLLEDSKFPFDNTRLMNWARGEGLAEPNAEDVQHTLHILDQFSQTYRGITETTQLIEREEDQLPPSYYTGVALLHFMGGRPHECHCKEYHRMVKEGVDFEAVADGVEELKDLMDDPSDFLEEKKDEELIEGKTQENLRPDTLDVLDGVRIWQN